MFNKRVVPNNHVGGNFSKTLIIMQLGTVYENPTIRAKKWELKVEKSQGMIN